MNITSSQKLCKFYKEVFNIESLFNKLKEASKLINYLVCFRKILFNKKDKIQILFPLQA